MATETTQLLLPALSRAPSFSSEGDIEYPKAHQNTDRRRQRKGLALSALSALAFAIMSLLVRVLNDQGFSALQIMAWRSGVQAVVAVSACHMIGVHPLRVDGGWKRFKWVLSRAVFGGVGHLLYYAALGNLPMGIATVLFFTNPLFTAMLAYWLLKEEFSSKHQWLSLSCLLGIMLIVKPTTGSVVSPWSFCALLGAASSALAYVSIRLAGNSVHAMVHVVYFGIVGAVGNTLASLLLGESWQLPVSLAGWSAVVGVGLMAFLAQFLMNWGLQLANAGPVVMMRNSDIVISFVFDIFIYHTVPGITSMLGAAVITASVISMSLL
ncbi:hypothetical protein GQ54DRAFT_293300 [Martensiomyces pterosporus]|nr:hypothetical protein GQ54DRAFT_293300 [Martensiomyces pterosporus]